MHKDTRKLLDEAGRQGFTTITTPSGHAHIHDPDGAVVAALAPNGDPRTLRNALHALHHAGLTRPRQNRK